MKHKVVCAITKTRGLYRGAQSFFRLNVFVLLSLMSACSPDSSPPNDTALNHVDSSTSDSSVTIFRDQHGMPHVVADTNYGVYYGFGYAVATDRLFQMDMLNRTAQGRVADVLGAEFIELDKHIRTAYDHRSIERQLAKLSQPNKDILDAYARGFSHRVTQVLNDQESLLPIEYREFGFLPQSWTAYDVAMIFIGSIIHRYSDFNSELDNLDLLNSLTSKHSVQTAIDIFDASKWLLDPTSPTTVPRTTPLSAKVHIDAEQISAAHTQFNNNQRVQTRRVIVDDNGRFIGTTDQKEYRQALTTRIAKNNFISPEFSSASTYWSVAGNKLSDADGALVNGPQFGFGLPSYVYAIGLHGGDYNVVGNTLLGLPAILFAHNGHIAWGSTAGMSDQVDVYEEQLVTDKENHYLHQDTAKPFETWSETIKVKNAEPLVVTAKRSIHGMVVSSNEAGTVAYSRARAWEGQELATLFAWIELSKQKDLDSAQAVIADVAANINFYYIDANGNQGYTHGGRYPRRVPQHDSRLPAKGTGEFDWLGYRPYSDNPTIRNPKQGYVVNWNNRPAAGWSASDLWTQTWSKADRATHIIDELDSVDNVSALDVWSITEKVSYDDVSAHFLLPYLFNISSFDGQSSKAISILKGWDREWRLHDDGQFGAAELIVEQWSKTLFTTVLKDDIGAEKYALYAATNNPNMPLGPSMRSSVGAKVILRNLQTLSDGTNRYDFFNGVDPNIVLKQTFDKAVSELASEHGNDLEKWSLPAAKMVWKPYNFRGVPQASTKRTVELPVYMNRGSENNFFVARNGRFEAYDVNPPGQSGFIPITGKQGEHVTDQLMLFADFEYKSLPFSIEEIKSASTVQQNILIE